MKLSSNANSLQMTNNMNSPELPVYPFSTLSGKISTTNIMTNGESQQNKQYIRAMPYDRGGGG